LLSRVPDHHYQRQQHFDDGDPDVRGVHDDDHQQHGQQRLTDRPAQVDTQREPQGSCNSLIQCNSASNFEDRFEMSNSNFENS
jgi:hypothetical protein